MRPGFGKSQETIETAGREIYTSVYEDGEEGFM